MNGPAGDVHCACPEALEMHHGMPTLDLLLVVKRSRDPGLVGSDEDDLIRRPDQLIA